MEFHDKAGSEFGGGTLRIKVLSLAFALLWLGLCLVFEVTGHELFEVFWSNIMSGLVRRNGMESGK